MYKGEVIDPDKLQELETANQETMKLDLLMIRENYDREKLKTAIATHRETWYVISTIKKDKRYIDQVFDTDIEGGISMDATLDRLIAEGEIRGRRVS